VQDSERENAQRWRAWRAACESGRDWAEAYDVFLHPATRIELDGIDADSPADDARHRQAAPTRR
jgi:hypothetical protein